MIPYCNYKYIALLDVDDIWHDEKLNVQSQLLNHFDVIGTKCVYFGDMNGIVPDIPVGDISDFNFASVNPIINSSSIIRKDLCHWNENGIELITLTETDEQKLKKLIAFFEILEADFVSEGVITQLWEAGHKSVKDILNLTTKDLEQIDRFGKRKAKIVFDSIQKSVTNVSLSKLQHSTGIFSGLGSKKLILLEHFTTKPTLDQVMSIEGFAEISAKSYIDSYDKFFDFIKDLPISIEEKVQTAKVGTDLDGTQFVFTGVRRADLEQTIESRGGKIGSSVSKNTTHLVMKVVGSGSSKEKKATDLGVKIITVEQLEKMLS
jgi:NAD-dependent DNA ligase